MSLKEKIAELMETIQFSEPFDRDKATRLLVQVLRRFTRDRQHLSEVAEKEHATDVALEEFVVALLHREGGHAALTAQELAATKDKRPIAVPKGDGLELRVSAK